MPSVPLVALAYSADPDQTPQEQSLSRFTVCMQNVKGALAIRRIFSLDDMITKPKFSNCPNVFKIGLFR